MYPKMLAEVIEALESYYCDEKAVLVDCLLYLKNATCREEDVIKINEWFDLNNRCPDCGAELETYEYREPHKECGEFVYETMRGVYCPGCLWGDGRL